MSYPNDRKYSESHEYVKIDGQRAVIGITDFAQDALGDIVFVELPEVGRAVAKGEMIATVESVKAVSDCYTPVSGTIVEVNENLGDTPDILNSDPHGEGWICVIEMSSPAEAEGLMDAPAYEKHLEQGGGHD